MTKYIELKENLLGKYREFDAMADGVSKNLDDINKLMKKLGEFSKKIGSPSDSDSFRKNLKDNLFDTTLKLKETSDNLNIMEEIQVNPSQTESRNREIRKLRGTYNKVLEEATKLMEAIEKQEKKSLQNVRISIQNKKRESLDIESHPQQQWAQMDLDDEILRERENDIIELTKLLKEMNALAKLQQNQIYSQGQEIEIIHGNISEAKKNVRKAKDELEEANHYKQLLVKSDTKCLMVALVVCVVFIILFLLSSNPEAIDSDFLSE